MRRIEPAYGRDLDLNLLRVFAVVADAGSVTAGAARLYLTQPAVSAALARLSTTVGAPLFVRQGRGIALTPRGERLAATVRPYLEGLAEAALSPPSFDPKTSERTVRLGLSDAAESWLLPALLRALDAEAPRMRLVVVPVQFRTVGEALSARRIDLAVTVADELPAGARREPLFTGGYVCLFDARRLRLPRRLTVARYLQEEHVIVSYNGDLRGVVEDLLGLERRVRVSVASFLSVGAVVDGTKLVATVPETVARAIVQRHPGLRHVPVPFRTGSVPIEIVWRSAVDGDDAIRFFRERITRLAREVPRASGRRGLASRGGSPA